MRTAAEFVKEYRQRGYTDKRIRVIANLTRDPLKSEVLQILDGAGPEEDPSRRASALKASPRRTSEAKRAETAGPEGSDDDHEEQLREAGDTIASLRKQLAAADRTRAKLEAALKREKERVTEAQEAAARLDSVLQELNDTRERLEEAQQHRAEQEATVAAARAEAKAAQAKADDLAAAIAEKEAALEEARAECKDAVDRATDLSERLAQRQAAVETAEAECQDAVDRATELSERLTESRRTIARLEARLAEMEAELEEAQSRPEPPGVGLGLVSSQQVFRLRRQASRYRTAAAGAALLAAGLFAVLVAGPVFRTSEERPAPAEPLAMTRPADDSAVQPGSGHVIATTGRPERPMPVEPSAPKVARPPARPTPTTHAAASPTEAPAPKTITHTVKSGDSLWMICKRYLNDGRRETVDRVARENGLSDPGKLRVGMKIRVALSHSGD